MKLGDVAPKPLQYGDIVKHVDEDSKYAGQVGKIIDINRMTAAVIFNDAKKPVTIILNGLQRA